MYKATTHSLLQLGQIHSSRSTKRNMLGEHMQHALSLLRHSWLRAKPLGLLTRPSVQTDAVACWVGEESEQAYIWNLHLRHDRLATKRLSLGKSGVDVVGRDINDHFSGLVGRIFTYLDEGSLRRSPCLEHMV